MAVTQTNCIACNNELSTPLISNAGVLCKTCASQGLFRKQIIITGITRMNLGHICVSGIDPQTWRFVRPLFRTGLTRDFVLDGATQVVNHFNLVELELTNYQPGHVYHTEDWMINESFAPKLIRHLSDSEIANVMNRMAVSNLNQAMRPQDKSLFIVKVRKIWAIWDEVSYGKFKVRMTFMDDAGVLHDKIPVTDLLTLAFVKYQKSRGNDNYSAELMSAFNANTQRYIRIGLTRPFRDKCWKQVTAIITIPDLFNGSSFSFYEKLIGDKS